MQDIFAKVINNLCKLLIIKENNFKNHPKKLKKKSICVSNYHFCYFTVLLLTRAIRQFCISIFGNLTISTSKTERIAPSVSNNTTFVLRR